MKILYTILFIFSFIFNTYAFTDLETSQQYNKNLYVNGGLEAGKTGWSKTGSGTFALETSTKRSGKASAKYTQSSTLTDSLNFPSVTVKKGTNNCESIFYYNSTSSAFVANVYSGSNLVATLTLPATNDFTKAMVSFVCTDVASAYTTKITTGTNGAIIYVDDAYIGDNTSIGNVAQAQHVGSIAFSSGDCFWQRASSAFGNFTGDSTCTATITGSVTTVSDGTGKQPAVKVLYPKAGTYVVVGYGQNLNYARSGSIDGLRFYDGTNSYGANYSYADTGTQASIGNTFSGSYTYTTAPTSLEIQTQVSSQISSNIYVGNYTWKMDVFYYPSQAEQVVKTEVANQFAATRWNTTTNSTHVTSGTFVALNISGGDSARTNYGKSTTQATAGDVALKIVALGTGGYLVSFDGLLSANKNTTNTACEIAITDGTTTRVVNNIIATTTTDYFYRSGGTAYFEYTSVADRTFTLQARRTNGDGYCRVESQPTGSNIDNMLSVTPVFPQVAMPQLVNSVTSTTNQSRIESVVIAGASGITAACSANPCTLYNNTGGFSSVAWGGTGSYTVNLVSGTFATQPTCTCSIRSSGGYGICVILPSSSTTFNLNVVSLASASKDDTIQLICHGLK